MNSSPLDSATRADTLTNILLSYLEAVENGGRPDPHTLLALHPEFAEELTLFFAGEAHIESLAKPLRPLRLVPLAEKDTGTETILGSSSGTNPDLPCLACRFDGYELLQEIGRGGMGVIYKARHHTLNREEALKAILGGICASSIEMQRFRAETEAAAALDHPHIVPIYQVGEYQGRPYFTMKLIEGGSLASAREDGRLPGQTGPSTPADPSWSAQMLATVARAVHYAHQHGILHRDLKPGNILLDSQGQPHVSDFGLAKRTNAAVSLTDTGATVGTPAYMAPERASGRGQAQTTTDVYSLGVILYELVSGRRPFQGQTPLALFRQIMECEPDRPRSYNGRLDTDLETVCLKCLSKEPERRYDSALALAEDLERWLKGEAVQARRSRTWERGLKWVRRQPALAATLAGAVVAVIGLIVVMGILWRSAERQIVQDRKLNHVVGELHDAQNVLADRQRELDVLGKAIDQRREEANQLHESNRTAMHQMRHALYIRDMHLARVALDNERISRLLHLLERHRPHAGEEDLRGFAWYYLWGLCHRAKHVLHGHPEIVARAVFTPDGKSLLAAGLEGTLKGWDAETGKEIPVPWKETHGIVSLVFAPGGRTLITGCKDGKVYFRDWPSGRCRTTLSAHNKAVFSVAISPDGRTLATGAANGEVKLWDRETSKCKFALTGHSNAVTRTVFSPSGTMLATLSTDRSSRLWDLRTRRLQALFMDPTEAWVADVAFSPNGKELAVVGMHPFDYTSHASGSLQIADISTPTVKLTRRLPIPGGGAASVAYTADSKTLIWGGNSGSVVLWDRATAQVRDTLHGHTRRIHTLALSPDGRLLLSGGNDRTLRLWNLLPRPERTLPTRFNRPYYPITIAPDGKRFASADEKGVVHLWSTANFREQGTLQGPGGKVKALAFAPNGKTLAVGDDKGRIHIWDLKETKERTTFTKQRRSITSLRFSPDGRTLASASQESNVFLWDMTFGWKRTIAVTGVCAVAFSPDGRTLAVAGSEGVALCDPITCRVRLRLPQSSSATCVAFSPDGERLAAGHWNDEDPLRMWKLSDGKKPILLQGHTGPVLAVQFTADGQTILSTGTDATIKFWDVATKLELFTLRGHHASIGALALSPDGQLLLSSSDDGSVRPWRASRDVPERK